MATRRLTRALKEWLPAAATSGLRRGVLTWGRLTSSRRMTPAFVVVGAQRTGTTTLFRLLADHPNLVRPTVSKGTGYFDDDYARGPRWYLAHFPLRAVARLSRRGRSGLGSETVPLFTFECSGYYLFHPLAAGRLAHDLPAVQVVVLVRDPVERARSAHRHESARGFEELSFEDALAREHERTAGEADRLAIDPSYRSFAHRHHAYLQRGEYALQIRRLVEALGSERVHVVDAGRFFANPVEEFVALQQALGLPEWRPIEVGHENARPAPHLDARRYDQLMAHFDAQDADLELLLGHQPSWRTAATAEMTA